MAVSSRDPTDSIDRYLDQDGGTEQMWIRCHERMDCHLSYDTAKQMVVV